MPQGPGMRAPLQAGLKSCFGARSTNRSGAASVVHGRPCDVAVRVPQQKPAGVADQLMWHVCRNQLCHFLMALPCLP